MAAFFDTLVQELRRIYRRRRRGVVRRAAQLPPRKSRAHHYQNQIESTRVRRARPLAPRG